MVSGKRLVVTGAATGIGQATAKLLMEHGAQVALWDVEADAIRAGAQHAQAAGHRCLAVPVDVASADDVARAMAQTLEAFGGLDGAFNNAGVGAPTVPMEQIEEADFDRVVGINLKGVWLCLRQQIACMRAGGTGGAIVNNASVAGLVALAMQGAYTAAKHGVVGLSKVAAVEGAAHGIRVNAICPGAVRTPILRHLEAAGIDERALAAMSPQARIADPEEIAHAVLWLLSSRSGFVTGAALPIDGGWSAQ